MKKSFISYFRRFLSLSLLAACSGGESETKRVSCIGKNNWRSNKSNKLNAKIKISREHRKQIRQQQRDELIKSPGDAWRLQMKQMLEEEKKQEEAKKTGC